MPAPKLVISVLGVVAALLLPAMAGNTTAAGLPAPTDEELAVASPSDAEITASWVASHPGEILETSYAERLEMGYSPFEPVQGVEWGNQAYRRV